MTKTWLMMAALACGCESPPKHNVGPEPKAAPVAATAPVVKPIAQPEAPPDPEQQRFYRIVTGAVADSEIPGLVDEAEKNRSITYAHLKKNADRYEKKIWGFRGKILEIAEADGKSKARISIDAYGSNVMFVEAPFETDFVEGNTVDVLGLLVGNFSYTSQAGWNMTIPAITAIRITKPGAMAKKKRRRAADDDE